MNIESDQHFQDLIISRNLRKSSIREYAKSLNQYCIFINKNPTELIEEAEKHGYNVTVEFKNFSDLGWEKVGEMVQDPNIALFFHEMYRRKWGHYEYPYAVCMDSKIVKMANSLSGGYLENRAFSEQEAYMSLLNQPSIVIVRKV